MAAGPEHGERSMIIAERTIKNMKIAMHMLKTISRIVREDFLGNDCFGGSYGLGSMLES